jgi:hypothetical protein
MPTSWVLQASTADRTTSGRWLAHPVIFLAAQGWYLWVVPRIRSKLHFIGGSVLLLVGFGTLGVPPYAALMLVGASLTILAIVDQK